MKKKNNNEMVRFAKELREVTGVNILDGRDIEKSVCLHRTAEMKRGRGKAELNQMVDEYLRNGGKITYC